MAIVSVKLPPAAEILHIALQCDLSRAIEHLGHLLGSQAERVLSPGALAEHIKEVREELKSSDVYVSSSDLAAYIGELIGASEISVPQELQSSYSLDELTLNILGMLGTRAHA